MPHRLLVVFFLLLCLPVLTGCQGTAPEHSQQWGPIAFDTPVPFSAPSEIGVDAVRLRFPGESESAESRLELTLVLAPKEYVKSLGGRKELLSNMTGVFLGLTEYEAAEPRHFLGASVAGWKAMSTVPRVLHWQFHLVPLADGSRVLVALARSDETTPEEASKVLDLVSRTFREREAGATGGE